VSRERIRCYLQLGVTRDGSRMRESRTSGCESSEGWDAQQEVDLPRQESEAP
jgi:hypothetical protein